MRRTQMYLTDEQRDRLAERAEADGVSSAEVIRRILDEALGLMGGGASRVAAVDATAGILADAPDWPEWLKRVRKGGADARLRELGL